MMFESQCMEFDAKFMMSDEVILHYTFNAFEHLSEELMSDVIVCKFILN